MRRPVTEVHLLEVRRLLGDGTFVGSGTFVGGETFVGN